MRAKPDPTQTRRGRADSLLDRLWAGVRRFEVSDPIEYPDLNY